MVFMQDVSQWLSSAPLNTYYRVNTLKITPRDAIATINEQLSKVIYLHEKYNGYK